MMIATSLALVLAAQAAPQASPPEPEADPIICEKYAEPGSLVKKKKVCMRKSEWAQQRQLNRQAIEKAQTQRGMYSGG